MKAIWVVLVSALAVLPVFISRLFDNADIQKLDNMCRLNDYYNCFNLDLDLNNLQNNDYSYQREVLSKNCSKDSGAACYLLGELYFNGAGVKIDREKANSYFEEACELNDGRACGHLAYDNDHGIGVRVNPNEAYNYYQKACELNYGISCFYLGDKYAKADKMKEAHYYYSKACSLKHPLSCYTLAQTYTKGKVVEKNLDKAKKLFKEACTLGAYQICNASY